MTAEEKLRRWFAQYGIENNEWEVDTLNRPLSPQHIDLIANLVVERLRNDGTVQGA